jgi:homocysteine S-methyltransferase
MPDNRFLRALEQRVILGDGAYGTEFMKRGCLPGRPFDELNLTRPDLVLDLHREYIAAGAELIKTNTFLANRLRLKVSGLENKTREINLAGVRLAREAARGAFVAGSVGPLTEFSVDEKEAAFDEQCRALAEGGCEILLLETFMDFHDLLFAVTAAQRTGLPLICHCASTEEKMLGALVGQQQFRPSIIGVNCVSPAEALIAVERLKRFQQSPISACPGGGLSGQELSPEEFANSIKVLVAGGARLVGGCCGAGPEHIRAAAAVVGRGR